MLQTLHLLLQPDPDGGAVLRYFYDNPNKYDEIRQDQASFQGLIAQAEKDFYGPVSGNLVALGRQLYDWLNGPSRLLDRAIKDCPINSTLVLAIDASATDAAKGNGAALNSTAFDSTNRLAHLPWEILHDGTIHLVQRTNPAIIPVRWQDRKIESKAPANRWLRVLFMATAPQDVTP
ncbi:MAG: hypothetical protein HQK60_20255, partial [Deltaproteobacteria bacterium]|nr:hypothetical protein [Deltaproteobacteria bacterium]